MTKDINRSTQMSIMASIGSSLNSTIGRTVSSDARRRASVVSPEEKLVLVHSPHDDDFVILDAESQENLEEHAKDVVPSKARQDTIKFLKRMNSSLDKEKRQGQKAPLQRKDVMKNLRLVSGENI
jgi:hypothetical protein